jgi:hypothetical protein
MSGGIKSYDLIMYMIAVYSVLLRIMSVYMRIPHGNNEDVKEKHHYSYELL